MQIFMNDEEDLEFSDFTAPGLEIDSDDPHNQYSALQMFATSIAICTYSILTSYAEQMDVTTDNISIRMRWSYIADPFRVKRIDMKIDWPELPKSRLQAAQKAASMCTIHNTLSHPPEVITQVNAG